jgi:hypothetical protein
MAISVPRRHQPAQHTAHATTLIYIGGYTEPLAAPNFVIDAPAPLGKPSINLPSLDFSATNVPQRHADRTSFAEDF